MDKNKLVGGNKVLEPTNKMKSGKGSKTGIQEAIKIPTYGTGLNKGRK